MNIIFMGSPSFAIPALEKLIESEHNIVAVYSQPPKPSGRGYKENKTLIHKLADKHNLTVKTPKSLRTKEAQMEFKELNADIAVVVAYGLILPQEILDATKNGCINIHPSSLPKYRGAAPLQRIILAGEKESSVCIIRMDGGIDTGDIAIREDLTIEKDITSAKLNELTANIGAKLIIQTLDNFENITFTKQSSEGSSYANKISKDECFISFEKEDIYAIDRKIRAFTPSPSAFFKYNDIIIKLKKATFSAELHNYENGIIIDKQFSIACNGGILRPLIMQREGKKAMDIDNFVKGFDLKIGSKITE